MPPSDSGRYSRTLDSAAIDPNSAYAHILDLAGSPRTVLDVGCNTGYLGALFMQKGVLVAGVDGDEAAVATAHDLGIDARVADLDTVLLTETFAGRTFDVVVFADVLEHLKEPDVALHEGAEVLAPDGRIVASIPNVAHANVRLDLLLGRFRYTETGLLDRSHLRFFTAESIDELFRGAGLAVTAVRQVWSPVDPRLLDEAATVLAPHGDPTALLDLLSSASANTLQYVLAAEPARDARRGSPLPSVWIDGGPEQQSPEPPGFVRVAEVPTAIAEMQVVIDGLEASLAETRAYLDTVIRDKDDVIAGLQASLQETRAYLDTVIRDKDEAIRSLTGSQERMAATPEPESSGAPTVTIVVVNWNGLDLLDECLASLNAQTYPEGLYRIVLVDNASWDDSISFVRGAYPRVEIIEANENLGFAGGNNLAISTSQSDYVALLNNDAVAEPEWLAELVAVAEKDPNIAAVNSKIWLTDDRLPIQIAVTETFIPGEHDPRRLGVQVAGSARVGSRHVAVEFTRGAFGAEHGEHGDFRWVSTSADLRIPIPDRAAREAVLQLNPAAYPSSAQPRVKVLLHGTVVAEVAAPREGTVEVAVPFGSSDTRPVVQNAGSVVLPDGAGSDRGTIVVGTEAFHELDVGQHDAIRDVPSFCGAACLLRRRALDEVGAFDSSFFMYYEDTDLALRLRAAGWRIVLAPKSRVRHRHSATSIEWSPMFCYFTERNRLLTLMKNGPILRAAKEWARYTARALHPAESPENRARFLRVERSLARKLPAVVAARLRNRRRGTPGASSIRSRRPSDSYPGQGPDGSAPATSEETWPTRRRSVS